LYNAKVYLPILKPAILVLCSVIYRKMIIKLYTALITFATLAFCARCSPALSFAPSGQVVILIDVFQIFNKIRQNYTFLNNDKLIVDSTFQHDKLSTENNLLLRKVRETPMICNANEPCLFVKTKKNHLTSELIVSDIPSWYVYILFFKLWIYKFKSNSPILMSSYQCLIIKWISHEFYEKLKKSRCFRLTWLPWNINTVLFIYIQIDSKNTS